MHRDLLGNGFYSLDRFRASNEAFLFAAQRSDPGGALVYLEQGAAVERRAFTKAYLVCPDLTCSAPELTTVNRASGGARDGYRHLTRDADRAHAPESMLHLQGKALIERWASRTPEIEDVDVEVRLGVDPVTGRAERVADVLLSTVHGTRIAVEIQYAGISVEEWQQRTASYRMLGIGVTWLFGSRGANSPRCPGILKVHRETLEAEMPLLWINPNDEVIGWLHHPAHGKAVTAWNQRYSRVAFGMLDDLEVLPDGLFPLGWHADHEARLAAKEVAEAAIRDQAEAEWQTRMKRAEELEKAREAFATRPVTPTEARPLTAREKRLAYMARKAVEASPPSRTPPEPKACAARPEQPLCRQCGLPIDPILKGGYHIGCG